MNYNNKSEESLNQEWLASLSKTEKARMMFLINKQREFDKMNPAQKIKLLKKENGSK